MPRKIVIEVETDSGESLNFIKRDIEQELSCCSTYFDIIKISEDCSGDRSKTNYCPNCGAEMFDKDTNVRSKGEDDDR